VAVSVLETDGRLRAGQPRTLFAPEADSRLSRYFGVSADGESFIMMRTSGRDGLSVLLDLPAALRASADVR
jgi:hypothetical protein